MFGDGWLRSGCVLLAVTALTVLARCSTKGTDDGAPCQESQECNSRRCTDGVCEGSDCTCEGPDCRGRSSCVEGWRCTRGDSVKGGAELLTICRRECTGIGTCPNDMHCGKGVCQAGGEPFGLAWESFPRQVACSARISCKYEVRVSGNTPVDKFTWTFGEAAPIDTTEPKTEFTYQQTGAYVVRVHARATSGATADLSATEQLCEGAHDAPCDATGAPCCEGACNAKGVCQ